MYPDDYSLNYEDNQTIAFFSLPYEVFSNWSAHRVNIFDHEFQTAEAAFQYAKFKDFAPAIAQEILEAPSAWKAFQITNTNREKSAPNWKDIKAVVMEQIIRAKVKQNDDVRQRLLDSGSKRIIENSPWDRYWGIGPEGNGENMLGQIYMKIRAELVAGS